MTQTITRLYSSYDTALQAALALKEAGFVERELSLVASRAAAAQSIEQPGAEAEDAATGAMFGGAIGAASGLLAGVGFLAIPGLGPVVAAGWLASTLAVGAAGAVAGGVTGGIAGALAGAGTAEEVARVQEGIRRGDSLVSVQVPDDRVPEATRILSAWQAVDLAAREAEERAAGWDEFAAAAVADPARRQDPVLPAGLPATPPKQDVTPPR